MIKTKIDCGCFTVSRIDILPSILSTQHVINLLPGQLDSRRIIFIVDGKSVNARFAGERI